MLSGKNEERVSECSLDGSLGRDEEVIFIGHLLWRSLHLRSEGQGGRNSNVYLQNHHSFVANVQNSECEDKNELHLDFRKKDSLVSVKKQTPIEVFALEVVLLIL